MVAKPVDTPKVAVKPPASEVKPLPTKPSVPEKEIKKPEIKKEEKSESWVDKDLAKHFPKK